MGSCCAGLSAREVVVHLLVVVFGWGSWLAVNSVFSELSFLVQTAPEGWNLASRLTLIIQLGNVIPLFYVLARKAACWRIKEASVIYAILVIGFVSSFCMGPLWARTYVIGDQEVSLYLYLFTFVLAFVDCTSSVTFFPFMSNYPHSFLVSLMVGEGFSGLIPSLLALAQDGGTVRQIQPMPTSPTSANTTASADFYCVTQANFSVEAYFFSIFALFFASFTAFIALERKTGFIRLDKHRETEIANEGEVINNEERENEQEQGLIADSGVPPSTISPGAKFTQVCLGDYSVLTFVLVFILCFFYNGAINSISTYILLPYGNEAMLVISNVGNVINPLTCIAMMLLPTLNSQRLAGVCTVLMSACSVVLIVFALLSPRPPWHDSEGGVVLVGGVYFAFKLFGTVGRVVTANWCRQRGTSATITAGQGKEHLFVYGVVTQAGSFVASLLFFILVNHANIFVSADYTC